MAIAVSSRFLRKMRVVSSSRVSEMACVRAWLAGWLILTLRMGMVISCLIVSYATMWIEKKNCSFEGRANAPDFVDGVVEVFLSDLALDALGDLAARGVKRRLDALCRRGGIDRPMAGIECRLAPPHQPEGWQPIAQAGGRRPCNREFGGEFLLRQARPTQHPRQQQTPAPRPAEGIEGG